jgi:hypothetical protein
LRAVSFSRPGATFFRIPAVRRLLPALALVGTGLGGACDPTSRPGDTRGYQSAARWEWHGRVSVRQDTALTMTRLSLDTTAGGGDVGFARYDFNPAEGEGDEYSLTLAFDLGRVRDLRPGVPYTLGPPPARIPAYGTVTCFCGPMKPDSVRGTFLLATRGLRQITGRVDATLYFTEWNVPSRHVTYSLHQRIDLVK